MGGKHFAAFPSRSFRALGRLFFRQFFSESSFNTLEEQYTMQVELGNPSSGPTDGELSSCQDYERRVWISLNASVGSLLPLVLFHFHLCFILFYFGFETRWSQSVAQVVQELRVLPL